MPSFFRQRTIWVPTWLGALTLFVAFALTLLGWFLGAESFLSVTERQPAEVLVVEGWIGIDGIKAAKEEFDSGGYRWIVTSGGPLGTRWETNPWNAAVEAAKLFRHLGVDASKVIQAPTGRIQTQRSFAAASAVREALRQRNLNPQAVNLFTQSVHARRSRLLLSKVMGAKTRVGSIAWVAPGDAQVPWWKSSDRALDLFKESIAYPYELLFSSGRW